MSEFQKAVAERSFYIDRAAADYVRRGFAPFDAMRRAERDWEYLRKDAHKKGSEMSLAEIISSRSRQP